MQIERFPDSREGKLLPNEIHWQCSAPGSFGFVFIMRSMEGHMLQVFSPAHGSNDENS